ncbi:hypothetical protein GCM10020331_049390 [Ectobacillus funiculus]
MMETAIQQAFHNLQLIPDASVTTNKKIKKESVQETFQFDHGAPAASLPTRTFVNEYMPPAAPIVQEAAVEKREYIHPKAAVQEKIQYEADAEDTFVVEELERADDGTFEECPPQTGNELPPLYPIGQMHGTYILAQNDQGLYILDQHAAQERINYEYFREKVGQVASEVQELLVPYRIDVSLPEFFCGLRSSWKSSGRLDCFFRAIRPSKLSCALASDMVSERTRG